MSHQPPFDAPEDPYPPQSEADVTSETRFGPRPVPEGHRPSAGRQPHHPHDSRPTPPHGDVSPDGQRGWPRPSPLAKWIVWGGTGLAAAALTAGTVLAARQVLDMVSGPERHPRRKPYRPEDAPRPRMHLSMTETPDEAPSAPPRRPSQPRRNLMEEIEANTATLSTSLDNVTRSVTGAVDGFRSVASQASEIVREFGVAAELVRDILGTRAPQEPVPGAAAAFRSTETAPRRPFHAAPKDPEAGPHAYAHHQPPHHATGMPPDLRDDPLLHDPAEGPDHPGPADHDPRRHRL